MNPHFTSFLGNEALCDTLGHLLAAGKFPHAALFEGAQGSGRRTLARLVAAALVCTGDIPACGHCESCRKAAARIHPDIHEMDPSARGAYGVGRMRKLIADAQVMPAEGARCVFILSQVEEMSEAAQNTLLKLLEEPPPRAALLLTSAARGAVLPTVASRLACFFVALPSRTELTRAASAAHPEIPPEQIERICDAVSGTLGSLLAALEGDGRGADVAEEFVRSLAGSPESHSGPDEYAALRALQPCEKNRELGAAVLAALTMILRDAAVLRAGGIVSIGAGRAAELLAERAACGTLLTARNTVNQFQRHLERSIGGALWTTDLCARLFITMQNLSANERDPARRTN